MKEAMLYEKMADGRVRCALCAHRCVIAPGAQGICRVRENEGGTLCTLAYGRTIAEHADPIEKKPLLHFRPGTTAYSVAAPGCNFRCRWCQNWEISQLPRLRPEMRGSPAAPEEIVERAVRAGCGSVAYTYTEPTVFFEYTYDIARLAKAKGLANVYVTNGYMTGEMLDAIHPYLDAANVDLKAFSEKTYREYVGGRLAPVLESLKACRRLGIWVEVTTLVIPGINDSEGELRDIARFMAGVMGVEVPWHVSRYSPNYEIVDIPSTPVATLKRAFEIGQEEGLRYVYVGNVGTQEITRCHACQAVLIRRGGFSVIENRVDAEGRCPSCRERVAGIGMSGGQQNAL
jgi:pyruvate formate lyase activating enzyme